MTGHCGQCQHWLERGPDGVWLEEYRPAPGVGVCMRIPDVGRDDAPEPEEVDHADEVRTSAAYNYHAWLITPPTFGCVLFEPSHNDRN